MGDHRSGLTGFSLKNAFFDNDLVVFWPNSMKFELVLSMNRI